MSLGFGATFVPSWFSYVFIYTRDNRAKVGFLDVIVLVIETGFAITAFLAIMLNVIISEDQEEEMESLMRNDGQEEAEPRTLDAIGRKSAGRRQSK
ncbi:uncharacterized protein K444DRAFT_690467 [Hyaloscypha bicolor E]|jgi:uric acid-xanthine permease|uniref:Uncharacterized protein n=1 Tax=Hyaloscypha bicolor E TaxID=1095630 RepID=A0A2J6TX79_9HELO|nr:uncharacterized protein K444DRAFT_690467 [Hyaloscypha bicolor E]PMD67624.1 hypothetical protein K444DRAFT_690467 [Hyaloscypha bicolor E]